MLSGIGTKTCGNTAQMRLRLLTKKLSSDSIADLCGIALLFDGFRAMLILYDSNRLGGRQVEISGRSTGTEDTVPLCRLSRTLRAMAQKLGY